MTFNEKLGLLASYAGTGLTAVAMCSWHFQGDAIAAWWWGVLAFCVACNVLFTISFVARDHRR